jgi:bleomycin hydrolase
LKYPRCGIPAYRATLYFAQMTYLRFFILILLPVAAFAQPATDSFRINKPVTISCTPVKDQSMSSTCWSFASMSFIESEAMRMGKPALDLSEIFNTEHIYNQKIIQYVKSKGGCYFTPGGQFQDVQYVIKNFGSIPETVYSGLKKGQPSHDHGELDTIMKEHVHHLLTKTKVPFTPFDEYEFTTANRYLRTFIGESPDVFLYNGKNSTPLEFHQQYVGVNPDDYVSITSYSHHPWYKPFVLENKYNWSSSEYLNVPFEDFMAITDSALQQGFTVLWNGDVTDAGFDFNNGLAMLDRSITNVPAMRQQTFADSTSYLDHVMHIVGYSTDDKGQRWYYVKNSWGNNNPYGGYLYMNRNYFAIKTAAIVVHKSAIPSAIREKLKL